MADLLIQHLCKIKKEILTKKHYSSRPLKSN